MDLDTESLDSFFKIQLIILDRLLQWHPEFIFGNCSHVTLALLSMWLILPVCHHKSPKSSTFASVPWCMNQPTSKNVLAKIIHLSQNSYIRSEKMLLLLLPTSKYRNNQTFLTSDALCEPSMSHFQVNDLLVSGSSLEYFTACLRKSWSFSVNHRTSRYSSWAQCALSITECALWLKLSWGIWVSMIFQEDCKRP